MQSDAERGIAVRDPQRFVHARLIHHEARVREQTRAVVALDGLVHRVAAAEVVSSQDEAAGRVFSLQFSVFSEGAVARALEH